MNSAKPEILVIMVTYNALPWLDRSLGSLAASSVPVDVMVVDNGSSDGTRERMEKDWPSVRLVCTERNLGFGAANNIGLQTALDEGYSYVYLMNQDAWLEKDTLEILLRSWPVAEGYGLLSPVQRDAAGRPDAAFARRCGAALSADCGSEVPVEVPFVMAAHWMLDIRTVRRIGGFSPAFTQYGEDDNMIDRLHFFGLKAGVVPAASAVHDRADRKTDKAGKMRLKLVSAVVKISDPGRSFRFWRCFMPFWLFGMGIKNLSVAPLEYIPGLMSRMKELKSFRDASGEAGAFLKVK